MNTDDTLTSPRTGELGAVRLRHALHRVWPMEQTVVLRSSGLVIGRAPSEGGLAIPDDGSLSREHVRLLLEDGCVRFTDAHSHNGTFVNGARVSSGALRDGDVLRCGDNFFVYRIEPVELLDASVPGLAGASPAVRALRADLARFAATRATVLLLGETGTGKTAAARALHALSGRRGDLVHVNAAAIPENVAESLLFGHRAGAFTGASTDSAGFFRAAHRGTLFLDEVGLLSPSTQARLLLAVESGTVTPVGATSPVPVDVRLVVATNEDLVAAAAAGRFRADLYARLAEVVLCLPPVRERREDILPLLRRLLGDRRMSPGLVQLLLRWRWPHNVREIEKVASELLIRGEGLSVLGSDLVAARIPDEVSEAPASSRPAEPDGPPTREALVAQLRESSGNVSELARRVGRSTKQIYRWCARYGLDPAEFR